jgi:Tfp pilus assembly protein PilN
MIHVNLLPEEYRRKNRTPIKMMMAVSAAVAVNGIALAWFAWLALGVAAETQSEHDVLATELDGLTPQVSYHRALEGEQTRYAAREKTLAAITQSRINWTRKVDELISVINAGGEGRRHFVWLDDLNVTQATNARAKTAGSVKGSGHSGSENFAQVANFLEDVENSPFILDFLAPAPPEGTQTLVDEELVPSEVWAFPLSLDLKSDEERATAHAEAAEED